MGRKSWRGLTTSCAFTFVFAIFAGAAAAAAKEDDIRCLQGVKAQLHDTQGWLSSWNFAHTSAGRPGFICSFLGITCWNNLENRVLELRLPSMSLAGTIPADLQYCGSIQNLDLSGNTLSRRVPSGLCNWLPFLVSLDLSGNQLTGGIPPELAECVFLNSVALDNNQLSGAIPPELARLARLNQFTVANNRLSGHIPAAFAGFNSSWFAGNDGLCAAPVRPCS